jgi:hypothetical protein
VQVSKIEILFILGLLMVTAGIACIYWPASLIFAGGALAITAFKLAQAEPPVQPVIETTKKEAE